MSFGLEGVILVAFLLISNQCRGVRSARLPILQLIVLLVVLSQGEFAAYTCAVWRNGEGGKGVRVSNIKAKSTITRTQRGSTSGVTGCGTMAPQSLMLGFLRSVENFSFISRCS